MITIADWNKIKAEYIAGGISTRAIAAKYGVSYNTLKDKAAREKWADARDDAYRNVTAVAQRVTAEQAVNAAEKLQEARSIAIVKVCTMIRDANERSGNNMLALVTALEKLQKMTEPEDTAALKSARELLEGIDSVID